MRVTVITPTYNRAHLLAETIESVLAQSYYDFEYLILDDGSTDDTKNVVAPYLSDARVRYYSRANTGEAETVNWGWRLAQGEYFTQINSDDPIYTELLHTMIGALEAHPNAILAYPDFDFVDADGKVISTTKGRHWDFLRNLSQFSCEAACPGTMIRRSALRHLDSIKRKHFLHINDIEMYWNLALQGDFLHVPKVLSTWRVHPGQISVDRYKCIPECNDWFISYFSQQNIPNEVRSIRETVRQSMYSYFLSLIEQAPLTKKEKNEMAAPYLQTLGSAVPNFSCLQIGDNDLIGNKFNGHDLHIYLREQNISASHVVCNKQSSDENTFKISDRESKGYLQALYYSKAFLDSDIVHLHLVHNTPLDIMYLPLLSALKPVVWTLHDPWAFGGHCIYPGNCVKWKTHCQDCPSLDAQFSIEHDYSALNFLVKKQAIQNSNIHAITASKWMYSRFLESPIWKNKRVYHVPFGINQDIFMPQRSEKVRSILGVDKDAFVIFARTQRNFKGLKILQNALTKAAASTPFTLFTVGEPGLLHLPASVTHKEYGWITNDSELAALYQACDIFLMPSEQEAFGMMAIEAMSCAKTVLALDTPNSSLLEVIYSPHAGIAVNEANYSDELIRLMATPKELKERGEKSLEIAKREYSHHVYVRRIIDVYRQVTAEFHLSEDAQLVLQQLACYPKKQSVLPECTSFRRCTRLKKYYKQHGAISTICKVIRKLRAKLQ